MRGWSDLEYWIFQAYGACNCAIEEDFGHGGMGTLQSSLGLTSILRSIASILCDEFQVVDTRVLTENDVLG